MTSSPVEHHLDVTSPRAAWRELARRAVEHRGGAALAVLSVLAAGSVAMLSPAAIGLVVDRATSDRAVTLPVVLLAVVLVLAAGLDGVARWLVARVGEHMVCDLRSEAVDRVLHAPLEPVERSGVGDLVARVGNDADSVSAAFREAVPSFAIAVVSLPAAIVGLLLIDWRLGLVVLAVGPVYAVTIRRYLRRCPPMWAHQRELEGVRSQQLLETADGAPTILALGLSGRHLRRTRDRSWAAARSHVRANDQASLTFVGIHVAELLGVGVAMVVVAQLVTADVVTVGAATAGVLYLFRAFDPIGSLMFVMDTARTALAALARLAGVLTLPTPPPQIEESPSDATLRLSDLGFGYDGTPALLGVDLSVAPGTTTALVGLSGSGKSTIGALSAGLRRPERGEVRLGGVDPSRLPEARRGRHVVLLTQDPVVFGPTVADDLHLARPDATDADLRAALDTVGWPRAGADADVLAAPAGLDDLSDVEARLLALARAALCDPTLLVLDEVTAGTSPSEAAALDRAVEVLLRGRTALVIAHRLAVADRADHVAVIRAGRVEEHGPPDELRAQAGLYAQLGATSQIDPSPEG